MGTAGSAIVAALSVAAAILIASLANKYLLPRVGIGGGGL